MLFRRTDLSSLEVSRQVEAFASFAESQNLSLDLQWLIERNGRARAACMLICSPGRCGTVLLSDAIEPADRAEAASALAELVTTAGRCRLRLVQALLEMDFAGTDLLAGAGFARVGELQYMERPIGGPVRHRPDAGLEWVTYGRQRHATFAQVIEASYEGSLDCPALTGVREIEEVIEAHKAAGVFEPNGWLLLMCEGQPVGVLLLTSVIYRPALEIVYMGLIPQARGRGLAHVLVQRAIAEAQQRGVGALMLAVDAGNTPARRVYTANGFGTTTERQVWLHVLDRSRST
ncbi:MAG TPA: GNAT family N-acetyltransferase [Phycisphaerae bacterium]|nr:GNAT family N-acetyltransferase [Phycisphaerae bacterium]